MEEFKMTADIESKAEFEASLHFNKEYDYDRWWACRCCFIAGTKALSAIGEGNLDSVPDLSTATEEEKETLVRGTMEAVAKPLLATYVTLGLKTHMVAGVVNEATGELYEISFKKMPLPNPSSLNTNK